MTNPTLTSFRQQTLESFDEKFVKTEIEGMKLTCLCGKHQDMIFGEPEDIRSFISSALTQQLSLVEEEVEEKMRYYSTESKKHLDEDRVMLAYDFDSRYVALKHFLARIKSGNEEQK